MIKTAALLRLDWEVEVATVFITAVGRSAWVTSLLLMVLLARQVSKTLHQSLGTEKNCLLALDRRIEISSQGHVLTHLGFEPHQS